MAPKKRNSIFRGVLNRLKGGRGSTSSSSSAKDNNDDARLLQAAETLPIEEQTADENSRTRETPRGTVGEDKLSRTATTERGLRDAFIEDYEKWLEHQRRGRDDIAHGPPSAAEKSRASTDDAIDGSSSSAGREEDKNDGEKKNAAVRSSITEEEPDEERRGGAAPPGAAEKTPQHSSTFPERIPIKPPARRSRRSVPARRNLGTIPRPKERDSFSEPRSSFSEEQERPLFSDTIQLFGATIQLSRTEERAGGTTTRTSETYPAPSASEDELSSQKSVTLPLIEGAMETTTQGNDEEDPMTKVLRSNKLDRAVEQKAVFEILRQVEKVGLHHDDQARILEQVLQQIRSRSSDKSHSSDDRPSHADTAPPTTITLPQKVHRPSGSPSSGTSSGRLSRIFTSKLDRSNRIPAPAWAGLPDSPSQSSTDSDVGGSYGVLLTTQLVLILHMVTSWQVQYYMMVTS